MVKVPMAESLLNHLNATAFQNEKTWIFTWKIILDKNYFTYAWSSDELTWKNATSDSQN